ncbi:MAG: c-type cytochrome, partial [Chthoniobacteraceae bacterium]
PEAATDAASMTPPVVEVSDATFRGYVAALGLKRNLEHGHEVFRQACAVCHRVGQEGSDFGPDLLGELGVAEETLVRHLLLPNERIRPGFETTIVEAKAGAPVVGLLKADGATSVALRLPGGVDHTLLRKDIKAVRRLPGSLMPSIATTLSPADVADLLAWLRSQLRAPTTTPPP